jgi:hypothetical protein
LKIYHADSNWVFIPLDGCIDINKKVSPLSDDERSISVRVIEHDLFSENDTYESDFSGVCESVNEGNGEFQFTSDGGTFTFKLEVARYSERELKRILLAVLATPLSIAITVTMGIPGRTWATFLLRLGRTRITRA